MSSTRRPSKSDVVTGFRRTQILDAARESFARLGLTKTTVDVVAKRAGVGKGTVYLYFKTKQDILRQVLDEDLAELHDRTVPVITGPGDIPDRLTRFIVGALATFDSKRDFFENVHFEMRPEVRRKAQQRLEATFNAQVQAWETVLAEAKRAGVVGDVDPAGSALAIVALTSGLAKQRLRGWTAGPPEAIARDAVATFWRGLAVR